jgi:hypothetical protein
MADIAESLDLRIARANRTALVRTAVLCVAVIVAAAAFLWFIVRQAEEASAQLQGLKTQIETASKAAAAADDRVKEANTQAARATERVTAAEAARTKTEAELKAAQEALKSAADQAAAAAAQAAKLQQQITDLEAKLAESQKALADAIDLQKHVYKFNWDELKMMSAESSGAAYLLEKLMSQKDRVHWGMSNTQAGGYNSPGFATLILQQLNRLPAGRSVSELPRADGPPHLGDVVMYASGYAMFFFRDHTREKKEFVIGMTPRGVLALNYDFGSRQVAVYRTGLSNR